MFTIKKDVNLLGLAPQMFPALLVVYDIFNEFGLDCRLSSGVEGKHMKHSHHYKGCAFDISLTRVDKMYHDRILKFTRERLSNQFQAVLSLDKDGNVLCLHCEMDPR